MSGPSVPLFRFVLKVHSRCDLACNHCYVYESADQSWRGRPIVIPDPVISQAADRIAEHAAGHALPAVQVILHGGEPLLAGHDRLRRIATELGRALGGVCDLDLRIHSNGVLLDEVFCELFADLGIKIGISIDGDRAANDRHRLYANGRSSYDKVTRAIGLLRSERFRHLYAGLLCTIDVANDPVVVYESLMALEPPRIDFLLPHATWENPPARRVGVPSEYADWLIAIYDRWVKDGRPAEIRTFDSIISTLRGGESLTEALGLGPTSLAVIETDGSYEQVDSLKVAFEGAPETGLDVFSHTLDMVAGHPGILARETGIAGLCQTCRECPVVASCGGGLYPHRYRVGTGFDNPSVYCPDLFALISHISRDRQTWITAAPDMPRHTVSATDFDALAAGFGGTAAIASLRQAQRSLLRALLTAVYQKAMTSPAVGEPVQAQLQAAWAVLAAVDRDQPDALAVVLGHPYLRTWAVRCLDQLRTAGFRAGGAKREGGADRTHDAGRLAIDLSHLGAVAAVAAARGRIGAALTVRVVNGAVHLPALGRLVLGQERGAAVAGASAATAAVNVISNAVIIQAGESCWTLRLPGLLAGEPCAAPAAGNSRPADWQPVRLLRAPGWCLSLDDIDLYRDCYAWPAAGRLAAADVARWRRDFRLAWQLIEDQCMAYAPGLATGLTTLTPLAAAAGTGAGAAVRHAPGAIAASPPADPAALARLLVQQFQRAKLGAILELFDLFSPAASRRPATSRGAGEDDLDGLLHRAYVHLAATDIWRLGQAPADDPAGSDAQRFAEWQAQAGGIIEALQGSGGLTELGAQFVERMRHSMSGRAGSAASRGRE